MKQRSYLDGLVVSLATPLAAEENFVSTAVLAEPVSTQSGVRASLRRLKHGFERKAGPLARPVSFAVVGFSGMVPDLFMFWLLQKVMPLWAAGALAIWVAMTWNFVLNRRLTFADARRSHPLWQYVLFCLFCWIGGLGNLGTRVLLCTVSAFFFAHPTLAAVAGVGIGYGLNYAACRYFVFRKQTQTPTAEAC